jgi:hypothetical protein
VCECDAQSVTVDKEHRLGVCKNIFLRKIYRCRKEETTKGLRKIHKEKLHNFYASLNISKLKRCAVYVAGMGDKRNSYRWGNVKENTAWKRGYKIKMVLVETE